MDAWKNTWERLEEAGVPILPVEALSDEQVRDRLKSASKVYGVDVTTKLGSVFFGQEDLDGTDVPAAGSVIAFGLDFDSNDPDQLAHATERCKGSCCFSCD